MDDKVIINNQDIAEYVMFKLNKMDNIFTKDELLLIDELLINYNNGDKDLSDITLFSNLKTITFRNGFIYTDVFNLLMKLNNITSITFDNCEFEEEKLIASFKLKELSIINSRISDYSFVYIMNSLETLSIINGEVEIRKLNLLTNLKYLEITNSNIIDRDIININNLNELYIDNTKISDLSFLNNLNNLNKVSIDEKQYENNKAIVNNLIKNGISFYNEAISPIVGDSSE